MLYNTYNGNIQNDYRKSIFDMKTSTLHRQTEMLNTQFDKLN